MANPLLTIERPNRAAALSALLDMREPAVWAPGAAAIIVLFLLAQNVLLCAGAVAITLYLSRLWSRLERKPNP